MDFQLPNGATLEVAQTIGAAITMSAVSNASTAVAALAASHGVTANNPLIITSGWELLNNTVVEAGTVTSNDVNLKGIDTTSTSLYPTGSGTGSVRRITAWLEIPDVLSPSSTPGDQQYRDIQTLKAKKVRRLPTVRGADDMSFSVRPGGEEAWFVALKKATAAVSPTVLRVTLVDGARIYYNGYLIMSATHTLTINEEMAHPVSYAMLADPIRYEAA